jgi:diphosphomevalonate decarboxylase
MTLDRSYTETTINYSPKKNADFTLQFYFEDTRNKLFEEKVLNYFLSLRDHLSFVDEFDYIIHSSNSFPHSAGIASSASAMSALALCLTSIEKDLTNRFKTESEFFKRASFLSRLGSGSASRSVYKEYAIWGESQLIKSSSDIHAIPLDTDVDPTFLTLRDTILIVDSSPKSLSSRKGHATMNSHIFADQRYTQAKHNLLILIGSMRSGDWKTFIRIVEQEALSLHAMMMTAMDPFILIKPDTLKVVEEIWQFRKQNNIPICFTLDAGPNVHMVYPEKYHEEVMRFVGSKLIHYCEEGRYIEDKIGEGPVMIKDKGTQTYM